MVAALLATLPVVLGVDPGCAGKLTGAVEATFECEVSVSTGDEGRVHLTVGLLSRVPGVPSVAPGSFDVTEVLAPGSYTLDELGPGRASVAAEGGTLFTATKTSSQRGEVRLVLTSVRKDAARPGVYAVHGTYRARLVPAGAGKTGEVVVEVRF